MNEVKIRLEGCVLNFECTSSVVRKLSHWQQLMGVHSDLSWQLKHHINC
jgi:hypothetical protein